MERKHTKDKIENYFNLVKEYIGEERKEDAAVNIRHILEVMVDTYVEQNIPAYIFGKLIDKIDALGQNKIIDDLTINTFHKMRILANKGAHGDGDSISIDELTRIIPPIELEITNFIKKLELKESDNTVRAYSNEWVEVLFETANSERELELLIQTLLQYEENDEAKEYIQKCKDKKSAIWKGNHAKEIQLTEIKEKYAQAGKYVEFENGKMFARDIYDIGYSFGFTNSNWYNIIVDILHKYNIYSITSWVFSYPSVYALLKNNKVVEIDIDKKTAKYVMHITYGVWDDIISIYEDDHYLYGITKDYRIRKEMIYKSWKNSKDYKYRNIDNWTGIRKLFLGYSETIGIRTDNTIISDAYNTQYPWNDVEDVVKYDLNVVALLKNGTVVCLDENIQKQLSDWKDIIQISAGYNHMIGLRADGTVVGIRTDDINTNKRCCDVSVWTNIVKICAFESLSIGVMSNGQIVSCGLDSEKYRKRIAYNLYNFENERKKVKIIETIERLKVTREKIICELKTTSWHEFKSKKALQQKIDTINDEIEKQIGLANSISEPYIKVPSIS